MSDLPALPDRLIIRRPAGPGKVELPSEAVALIAQVARLAPAVMWYWGDVAGGIDGKPFGEIFCITPDGRRFGLLAFEGGIPSWQGEELMKLVNLEYHKQRMVAKCFQAENCLPSHKPSLRWLAPEAFPELDQIDALILDGQGPEER